jgi:hypothetical protein
MKYFTGKLPAKPDARNIRFLDVLLPITQLPPRPRQFSVTSLLNPYPAPQMWGNGGPDGQGDCVEVAICNHQTAFEIVELNKVIGINTSVVLNMYHAITGPGDNGTVYLDAMNYWHTHGVRVGCKNYTCDAFTAVDWTNLEEIKYAIWLLNGCQVGVQVPQSMMSQFDDNQPWSIVPTDQLTGEGHGLFFGGYDDDTHMLIAWSWAREQPVYEDWLVKYGDEAYGVVDSKDSLSSKLNIPLLDAYLAKIAAGG